MFASVCVVYVEITAANLLSLPPSKWGTLQFFFFLTLHLSFLLLDKRTALMRQCNAPLVNAGKPA